jgi:thiazole biosynthesis enzyme
VPRWLCSKGNSLSGAECGAGKNVLDEVGVACRAAGDGYFLADSVECVAGLCFAACRAGATLMNLLSVEDVRVSGEDVTGLVINWSAVEVSKLHVDPLTVGSRFIIDATGHAAEVVRIIERKMGKKLLTTTGGVVGEQPMWAEVGERVLLENTREAYPNVYVTGMACNAVFGAPRMGPIFGGMLLSGKKAAHLVLERLQ